MQCGLSGDGELVPLHVVHGLVGSGTSWLVVAVGVSCFVYFRGMPGQECVLVKHTDGNITSGV